MNFSCSICCIRFQLSDEIFSTRCGHIFHFTCLSEWLNRSSTCPQCRKGTTSTRIHRLYFEISNNDSQHDDSAALRERIKSLTSQIQSNNTYSERLKEKSSKFEREITKLKRSLSNLENDITLKNSEIHSMKIDYKHAHENELKYKQQAKSLRIKLYDLKTRLKKVEQRLGNDRSELQKILENCEESQSESETTSSDTSGSTNLSEKSTSLDDDSDSENDENSPQNSWYKENSWFPGDKRKINRSSGSVAGQSTSAKKPRFPRNPKV